jgi:hypothetical protein
LPAGVIYVNAIPPGSRFTAAAAATAAVLLAHLHYHLERLKHQKVQKIVVRWWARGHHCCCCTFRGQKALSDLLCRRWRWRCGSSKQQRESNKLRCGKLSAPVMLGLLAAQLRPARLAGLQEIVGVTRITDVARALL